MFNWIRIHIKNKKMKHKFIFIPVLCAAVCIFFSCSSGTGKTFENVTAMVEAEKENTRAIGAADLNSLIEEGCQMQIIDCREESDYLAGHIPGAVNIPRGILEFSPKISNRRLKTIVIGNDEGSAILAAATLKKLKYFDSFYLDCSWEDWTKTFPELIEEGSGKEEVILKKVKAPEGC
jgi:rhodanese-related sulfurtransferase